WTGF
ncbi:putative pregnancy-specific beta-1-glycoprotein 7 isoform 2, partial [Daubentonia madagascariensis]